MMSKFQRRFLLVLVIGLILPLTSSGCWDRRGLTDLGFAVAAGVDYNPETELLEMTVQIVRPSVILARQQGSTEKAYWTFSTKGVTGIEAIRNMLTTVHRVTYYSHVQIIVIGEAMAKAGLMDMLDVLERNAQTRRRAFMLVAKGMTAREVINAESDLEDLPAMHLVDTLGNSKAYGQMRETRLIDVLRELNSEGIHPVIGTVQLKAAEEPTMIGHMLVEGSAAFNKDYLVGWLSPKETRSWRFIMNDIQSGILTINNPDDPSLYISVIIGRSTSKLDVEFREGKPVLTVKIKQEGFLADHQDGNASAAQLFSRLEEEIKATLEEELTSVIRKVQQEFKSDIFGFGEIIHKRYLERWRKIKDWDQLFSEAEIEVKVTSKLRRSGLISKPTRPK